jgi:hypothetical protein
VALFNQSDTPGPAKVAVQLQQLGFSGTCKVRDLWAKEDIGSFKGEFTADINSHGAGLYKISGKKE